MTAGWVVVGHNQLKHRAFEVYPGDARLNLKGTVVGLVVPDNDRTRGHLDSRGEGVLSLELRGPAVKALDPKLLHGADLAIVG